MRTKYRSSPATRHSPLIPLVTAVLAAVGLFTTACRATAQTGWGYTLSFDGVDDYVAFNRPVADDFTLECRFRTTQQAGSGSGQWWSGMGLVDGEVAGVTRDFGLSVGGGQLLFGVGGTSDTTIRSGNIADGLWHHMAATRQRSSGAIQLYVDGDLVASGTGGTLALDSPVQMRLGSLATGINFFSGQIDEVRIWNRVRGQAEIRADMLHPLTGSESSLASYWPLDEGTGSTTRDASRFGNTGVLVNGPTWQDSSAAAPVAYPGIEANWGAPGEVHLSCNAVPGAGLRVLTASSLTGPWQPLPGYSPIRATNDLVVQAIGIQPGVNFLRTELEPMVYAITDVMVSDNSATVPSEYTGLGYNIATAPYVPGVMGARVQSADVNIGIGGSTTGIWAKYRRLGAWMDADTPVLTDIAVMHWTGWSAVCPDGHALSDANPVCVDGWQRASGTSAGLKGALTTGTSGSCWRNGLCVRYRPIGDVLAQYKPYVLKLSLSVTTGGITYPPNETGWANDTMDIHSACGDSRYVFVCFKKDTIIPSPIRYGITDVMVTDNSAGVPSAYTGLRRGVSTGPYIPGVTGVRIQGGDVNVGIGGTTTTIWAKYVDLETATDLQIPVLRDIAVVHWAGWNAVCPDGHTLSDANPVCVDGWQRASGTSAGIKGALTTGTDGDCWRNGLCVRYQPLSQVLSNNALYIDKLSLSVTSASEPSYPSDPAAWRHAPLDIHSACGDSRYVYVCFAKRGFTPPLPPNDEQKLDLLNRYAPMVWLAQNERFMPSSVEWAFGYLERFLNTDGRYWLRTTNALSSPSDSTLPVFAGNLASAPVYAFWVEKESPARLVDLVYFFYYPYNRGKEVVDTIWGNHVSDWEHFTVRLNWGQPEAVYFPTHDTGEDHEWGSIPKTNLTHTIIYSAWGSHGTWPQPGSHNYKTIKDPILGIPIADLYDDCSAGTAWNTWEQMKGFDYQARMGLGSSQWPVWMSIDYGDPGTGNPSIPGNGPIYRWGNPQQGTCMGGECQLNDGPTGPAAKGVWDPTKFQ